MKYKVSYRYRYYADVGPEDSYSHWSDEDKAIRQAYWDYCTAECEARGGTKDNTLHPAEEDSKNLPTKRVNYIFDELLSAEKFWSEVLANKQIQIMNDYRNTVKKNKMAHLGGDVVIVEENDDGVERVVKWLREWRYIPDIDTKREDGKPLVRPRYPTMQVQETT